MPLVAHGTSGGGAADRGGTARAVPPPLVPPPLFEVPGLGSGLPPLGNIFLQDQALAPSFLAQVFSSTSGDGSGVGFLGFGGGDVAPFFPGSRFKVFDH